MANIEDYKRLSSARRTDYVVVKGETEGLGKAGRVKLNDILMPLQTAIKPFDFTPDFGTLSATNGTFALDPTVPIQGLPSVKAAPTATSPFTGRFTFNNPVSFAKFENIVIPLRITSNEAGSGIGTSAIDIVLTTTTGKTVKLRVHTLETAPSLFYAFEWHRNQDKANANFFNFTGGATVDTLDSEAIATFDLTFTTGANSANYPIWIGPPKLNCKSEDNKGIICITADGPYASHKKIAAILEKYDVEACFAIRKQLVGDPAGLTEEEIIALDRAGHDIIAHVFASNKTAGLINATDWPTSKSIADDYLNHWEWMRLIDCINGIGDCVRAFNDIFPHTATLTRQLLIRDGLIAGGVNFMRGSETVVNRKIPVGYGRIAPLEIIKYAHSTSQTSTAEVMRGLVDRCADTKELMTILIHGLDGGAGNQGMTSSAFEAFIEYAVNHPSIKIEKFTEVGKRYFA